MRRPPVTDRSIAAARRDYAGADRARDSERGDTLIEVLVAVVIIGGAVAALLGALLTSTSSSVVHRNATSFEAYVSSFAETARNALEFQAYNGSGTGPIFAPCASPSSYQLVGSPLPKSGPPGASVAVLGTGFTPSGGSNGTFSGAAFNGSSAGFSVNAINSSSTGDIGQFTVPTLPAGSYQVTPFDGGPGAHPAASAFTITPWVGAMSPSGAGRGPGSSVIISSVTGFAASKALTVTIGSNPPISTGTTTSSSGTASNVAFTIPAGLTGSNVAQQVTVSDGTNASQQVVLSIVSDSASQAPPYNVASFNTFETFNSTLSYWDGSWTTDSANCTGPSYNPNIQQLGFNLVDNQPNNGSGNTQTIVVTNFNPQGLAAPPVTLSVTTPSGVPQQLQASWYPPTYQGAFPPVTTYKLYRSTTSGGPWGPPTTVPSSACTPQCSYTDAAGMTNGETYYYQVTAVTLAGESQPSNQANGTTVPGVPAAVHATGHTGQVTLTWTAPTPNGDAPISGYNVYCSTSSGTQGTKVNTTLVTSPYTDTTCNGSALSNGTIYYYEVTAVNVGAEGQPSTQVSAATLPGPPTGLTATPGNGQLSLSWSPPTPNGNAPITGYNVYCSTTSGTQGAKVNTTPVTSPYTDTTCNGSPVSNGQTYYFEVTALNASGEGASSSQVHATAGAPTAPTSFSAAPGSSGHGGGTIYFVTLRWFAPSSTNGSPIISFNIYRSTTPTMPTVPLTTVPATGSYPATYPDSTVAHGTTYYYWITAVNSNGEGPPAMVGPVTP